MRSEKLDNMSMDEVLAAAKVGFTDQAEYWLRVAACKLSEYRRDMPRLEKFGPFPDWRAKADEWQRQIDEIKRIRIK